ncbi:MAG: hypothetical protein AAF485_28135 [Chloroflexota bacterium]
MDLTSVEQTRYQSILANVQSYIDSLAPTLQTICQSYLAPLSEREFIQMMSLLPYWSSDIFPLSDEVYHQLGVAHFYICWYYHTQDDLLDEEAAPGTVLGAHLALLKAVEIYEMLGVVNSPCWPTFQSFTQTSAETYALEVDTHFKALTDITTEQLAAYNVEFVGNRVTPFYFNSVAQGHLAGFSANSDRVSNVTAALRAFMAARQIGDDMGDWLTDLQENHLNYVSARLIERFATHYPEAEALTLERLAGYQIRDETVWEEIEQTLAQLNQQAKDYLINYAPCTLQERILETQIANHTIGITSLREVRGNWQQMMGIDLG